MKPIKIKSLLWLILCLSMLTACTSPLSSQIDIKAEHIAAKKIQQAQSTQTQAFLTTLTPQSTQSPEKPQHTAGKADSGQNITIKGFYFYSIDPLEAYAEDMVVPYEAFVGLTRIDSETGEAGPGLASSWKVSKDQLTWTFKLRNDISWVRYDPSSDSVEQVKLDGEVRFVTAADVVYGISRILDPDNASSNAFILQDVIAEDKNNPTPNLGYAIYAKDEDTLEVVLKTPTAYFDAISELPVMAAQPGWLILENPDDWLSAGIFTGYGPYVLKDWIPDQFLTLIRNPFWKGTKNIPEPSIETITFALTPNNSPVGDFIISSPEISLISDPDLIPDVRDNPSVNKYLEQQYRGCVTYLTLNAKIPPLDIQEVRRALSLAIDRNALVNDLYNGVQFPATQLVMPGSRSAPITDTDRDSPGIFDPETAKSLLGSVYPDIAKMPAISITVSDTESSIAFGNQLHDLWLDTLGIDVAVITVPAREYYDLTISENPPMISRRGYCLDYNDAANILAYLTPDQTMPTKLGWNVTRYTDLLSELGREEAFRKRTKVLSELETFLVSENAYVSPIYWSMTYALVLPKLHRTYSAYPGLAQFEKWWLEK